MESKTEQIFNHSPPEDCQQSPEIDCDSFNLRESKRLSERCTSNKESVMSNVTREMNSEFSAMFNNVEVSKKVQQGGTKLIFSGEKDISLEQASKFISEKKCENSEDAVTEKCANFKWVSSSRHSQSQSNVHNSKGKQLTKKPANNSFPKLKLTKKKKPRSSKVNIKTVETKSKRSKRSANTKRNLTKCCMCNKLFSESKNLKEHLYIHLGVKPYHCEICGKLFSHSGSYRRHKRRHSGFKHQCYVCLKFFTRGSYMKRHIKMVHADIANHIAESNTEDRCSQICTSNRENDMLNIKSGMNGEFNKMISNMAYAFKVQRGDTELKFYGEGDISLEQPSIFIPEHKIEDFEDNVIVNFGNYKCESSNGHSELNVHNSSFLKCMQSSEVKIKADKKKYKKIKKKGYYKKNSSQCCMCNKIFSDSKNLKEHLYIHLGVKPFHCEICDKLFSHSGSYRRHKRSHSGLKHQCFICLKFFTRTTHLKRHIKTMHSHVAIHIAENKAEINPNAHEDIGQSMIHTISDYKGLLIPNINDSAHDSNKGLVDRKCIQDCRDTILSCANNIPGSQEGLFQCSKCTSSFSNRISLQRHRDRVHRKNRSRMCEICCKFISVKSRMNRHMLTHTGIKSHKCEICNKSFTRSCGVKRHMMTHTGEKPHKCEFCDKEFSCSTTLKHHMHVHTEDTPYRCNICSESFASNQNLMRHNLIHTGKVPLECTVCGKLLSSKRNLRRHQFLHTGEKPFNCEVCKKSFSFKRHLEKHMVVHTDERPYHCSRCDKSFQHHNSLKKHELVHSREKPFKCEFCTDSFEKQEMLQRHLVIHSL